MLGVVRQTLEERRGEGFGSYLIEGFGGCVDPHQSFDPQPPPPPRATRVSYIFTGLSRKQELVVQLGLRPIPKHAETEPLAFENVFGLARLKKSTPSVVTQTEWSWVGGSSALVTVVNSAPEAGDSEKRF
ncbi:hypothetical protein AAFF_G00175260 [Aldrovandia affinis]|uniref:Uncharacterized protein n=1 Tax=Aldrovandia affinis TaxID=143900 RepID=A0AAD7R091_9TELE|nr:hypothetical protein AAFF_G00175260 [Aldrovandia affinis]